MLRLKKITSKCKIRRRQMQMIKFYFPIKLISSQNLRLQYVLSECQSYQAIYNILIYNNLHEQHMSMHNHSFSSHTVVDNRARSTKNYFWYVNTQICTNETKTMCKRIKLKFHNTNYFSYYSCVLYYSKQVKVYQLLINRKRLK